MNLMVVDGVSDKAAHISMVYVSDFVTWFIGLHLWFHFCWKIWWESLTNIPAGLSTSKASIVPLWVKIGFALRLIGNGSFYHRFSANYLTDEFVTRIAFPFKLKRCGKKSITTDHNSLNLILDVVSVKKRLCLSFLGEPCFIKNTRIDSQIRIKFHQLRPLGIL